MSLKSSEYFSLLLCSLLLSIEGKEEQGISHPVRGGRGGRGEEEERKRRGRGEEERKRRGGRGEEFLTNYKLL